MLLASIFFVLVFGYDDTSQRRTETIEGEHQESTMSSEEAQGRAKGGSWGIYKGNGYGRQGDSDD